jgi:hypothetical protein
MNMEIAEFIGPDPDTLRAMGGFCADFKEDVAELLEKAIVHVGKMRVMKELLEFANGRAPVCSPDLEDYMSGFKWSAFQEHRLERFYAKRNLWDMLTPQTWE